MLRLVPQCRQGFERELAGELKPNECFDMGVLQIVRIAARNTAEIPA